MDNNIDEVTVIIPAFNCSDYISTTLNSVQAQTYQNFKVLIVDDKSTDNTVEIVKSFCSTDTRFQLVELDNNYGAPAGPRNVAISLATTKWVAFLDGDDIWHPEKLEKQMRLLSKTGAEFCSTSMFDFYEDKSIRFRLSTFERYKKIRFINQLTRFDTPTSSVVALTSLLKRFPFNEDPKFKAREDVDCWLHCHEAIKFSVKILDPMLAYRKHDDQISRIKIQMFSRHLHVLKNYKKLDGSSLGVKAYWYTLSHFFLGIYWRYIRGML